MAYKVAGGSKWWQVRAGPGVEAEWIVLKKDWKDYTRAQEERGRKEKESGEQGTGAEMAEQARQAKNGMLGDDGGMGDNGECTW
jgi:hypothetical protein